MSEWITAGKAEGAPELRALDAGGRTIAVARLADGSFAAFDDDCTHEECPLSEGDLEGEKVVCYCHSSEFDVRTGAVLRGPATEPVHVYEVAVVDGEIRVRAGRG